MLRSVFLLLAAGLSCRAAQITQFVSCGGATQTLVTNLPQQSYAGAIGCNANGVQAMSGIGNLLTFDNGARPIGAGPQTPPGNVESSLTVNGNWVLSWLGGGPAVPAFWSFCSILASGAAGSFMGTGSITVNFGGYALGSPCDFSHATPLPSNGSVTIAVSIFLDAKGNFEAAYTAGPEFFDSNGNLMNDFALVPLPDAPPPVSAPEPSMAVPIALVLTGWNVRRFRRA